MTNLANNQTFFFYNKFYEQLLWTWESHLIHQDHSSKKQETRHQICLLKRRLESSQVYLDHKLKALIRRSNTFQRIIWKTVVFLFLFVLFCWVWWFRPIVRMHAAGQWLSSRKRKNDSVGRLLGVWSLLRHVDSWKRWSQKSWPRRMGQDWCARRRKRSSSGCCPCGPRVHPSSRLVRARVKLFLRLFQRVWYLFVKVSNTNVPVSDYLFSFFFFQHRRSGWDLICWIN